MFLAAAASSLPNITIAPAPRGFVARVIDFDGRKLAAVDAEIDRRARELCKDNEVRWGDFSATTALGKQLGAEPPIVRGYTREFACIVPQTVLYAPAPGDWKATAEDLTDAQRVFQSYYGRRDGGDFTSALKLFAPDVIGDTGNWAKEMQDFNAKLGEGKRRITAVTWDVNPANAPHPGVYVSLDFVGDYPSMYFYCGYLALYRRGPGSYEIVHEEQNTFGRADGNGHPTQVAQMRAAMCAGE